MCVSRCPFFSGCAYSLSPILHWLDAALIGHSLLLYLPTTERLCAGRGLRSAKAPQISSHCSLDRNGARCAAPNFSVFGAILTDLMSPQMRVIAIIGFLFCSVAVAQEPKPLAQFSLPKLDGQTLRSEELKDNIVVLDFWATWCENCIGEIPAFNKLQEEYSTRGVKVIGMAVQSGWASDIQKFASDYKMQYPIVVGNDDTVSDFGVISFPATYVIAPGWKLYKKYSGSPANKGADIERDIET